MNWGIIVKLRHHLAGSAAALALIQGLAAMPAMAQQPPPAVAVAEPTGADTGVPGAKANEEITVTGSRIKTTNATSENPVTVVTSADIAHSSAQTLSDVLQRLPVIGTAGELATTNNGGEGAACVDIRNLGVERTLVLVDGKRFVHSGSFGFDCVDLNNIPLDLVDRIEILKDGASTTYGADAVAGVINIILKHNVNGVVFKGGGLLATDAGIDDQTGDLSVTAGHTFDHGNFTISAQYQNRAPVPQANRNWAIPPVQTNDPVSVRPNGNETGSIFTPGGIVFADGNSTNVNNQESLFDLVGKNNSLTPYAGLNSQRFDFGTLQDLSGSLEKESFTSLGNYDFTDSISGYLQTYFTHKKTSTQLAPQPVDGGLSSGEPDEFVVPQGNPYLTALLGADSGPVDLYERVVQFGPRQEVSRTDTFQFNGGFKGTFRDDWDWDLFAQYGQSDNNLESMNEINFQRLEQEMGFSHQVATPAQIAAIDAVTGPIYGNNGTFDASTFGIYDPSVCQSPCVLANPFGPGSYSQAAINYARFNEVATSEFTLRVFGGTVTNSNLLQLPAGPVGLSLGVEHRTEFGSYTPDNLVQTGVTLENSQTATNGQFSVTEVYGETRIPILKDAPFAKDLHVDLGGRFFDYNTFGSGETWKVSGNYTPFTGIRFRATDGTAFRQPSIQDLYGGEALSFVGATDPCAQASSYGAKAGIVTANCAKQGVNTATFTQVGSQIQTIQGGNPALDPETARTQTVGIVVQPPFIPRSALTVDYFRYKIANNIGSVDTQDIVDGCYTSVNFSSPFCKDINARLTTGQLSTVNGISQNLGVQRTEGLDIGTNYTYLIPGHGALSLQNDFTYVFQFVQQNLPNGPFINFNGTIGTSLYSQGYPRIRDNFSADYRLGNFQFGYRMRFIDGMLYYPLLDPKTNAYVQAPGIFYHDIVASYDYRNFTVSAGIDNLFDKAPPFVPDTATNTDPQVYDVLGRVIYLKTTLKF